MNAIILNFTIKHGATLTCKATGTTTRAAGGEQTGELRGAGLYFEQDGARWRVNAKDVTGMRRAA